jgi:hypothetical protein
MPQTRKDMFVGRASVQERNRDGHGHRFLAVHAYTTDVDISI